VKKQIQKSASGLWGGVLRKVPLQGVAEIRVPSDIRRVLVSNIENLRENALDIFAKEISKVLSKVDFQSIIDDVLKNYTLKIEAKVELHPKGNRNRNPKPKGKK
jgi:hypothetical protein